jgi:hypothetical protein
MSVKMIVYWDVAPCSLVEIDRRFRGDNHYLHYQGIEAVSSSETSVNFLRDYTVQHSSRQSFSRSPPGEF